MEQLFSLEYIISILLSGISLGGQLALIAIGYTMVYGILRLINFAHGDLFMVAGLLGIYISAALPIYVAIPVVILMTVVLGFTIERAAYKPLRDAPRMSVMISAIGVSYLLQNTATYITGGQPMTYPAIDLLTKTVNIAGTPTKMENYEFIPKSSFKSVDTYVFTFTPEMYDAATPINTPTEE